MADSEQTPTGPTNRGSRGSHKPRGGFGKYLRARGRGRGRGGRPAEFSKRLVLEGEERVELDEEEAKEYQRELQEKYGKRNLGSNADRYAEPEPELDSGGEEIVEPEVDLSEFLERQKLSPEPLFSPPVDEDDDIDHTLDHHHSRTEASLIANEKKGKIQQIQWDETLEEMSREKASADASRDLKARFRSQATAQRMRSGISRGGKLSQKDKSYVEAPALPTDVPQPPKSQKEDMEEFLDDLLN
ncbi:hypothetical protein C8Q75DRAFT_718644 [Abortiporus biennis]|nr:hypothetical protein C8Q75DRAFT_718644 [Abortiporus biennis]